MCLFSANVRDWSSSAGHGFVSWLWEECSSCGRKATNVPGHKKLKIRKVVRVQILISFTVSLRQERSNYCHEQSSSISLTFLNANKHLQLFRPRCATPQGGTGIVVPVLLMRNEPCCPGVLSLNYKKTSNSVLVCDKPFPLAQSGQGEMLILTGTIHIGFWTGTDSRLEGRLWRMERGQTLLYQLAGDNRSFKNIVMVSF